MSDIVLNGGKGDTRIRGSDYLDISTSGSLGARWLNPSTSYPYFGPFWTLLK